MTVGGAQPLTFSETEIQALFGHEAAEDEDPARLRKYYFKSSVYDQVVTDLPLRLLVGHKGIGKSALFQIAIGEDIADNRLTLTIKPDDVLELGDDTGDFLKTIRSWKAGLLDLLAEKAVSTLGGSTGTDGSNKVRQFSGHLLEFLRQTIKDPQALNLDAGKRAIADHFLKTSQISVYIDDLDRGWQGRPHDITRISALLNAVRDITNENRGIRFRISLRSDVYFLVRTADESTDKIEGSVVWHTWTNHEIFALLVKRIETFYGREPDLHDLLEKKQPELARYLEPVFEDRFLGAGHWANAPTYRVLMSLIRKRPRDLVKLCSLAGRAARLDGSQRIGTASLKSVFEEYSQGRIQDTINEFRSELPDIDRLVFGMKPSKPERRKKAGYIYPTANLIQKLGNIEQSGAFDFTGGKRANEHDLAAFLYKINFLTARKENSDGSITRKYFEESRYLQNSFADFGFDWEIHPAYRWALQPDKPDSIFTTLELSADDSG
jgi:hypothetical protein